MITRQAYARARRQYRANGFYALKWMPEDMAQVFTRLDAQPLDLLAARQHTARTCDPAGCIELWAPLSVLRKLGKLANV